jgi:hypothetical protein
MESAARRTGLTSPSWLDPNPATPFPTCAIECAPARRPRSSLPAMKRDKDLGTIGGALSRGTRAARRRAGRRGVKSASHVLARSLGWASCHLTPTRAAAASPPMGVGGGDRRNAADDDDVQRGKAIAEWAPGVRRPGTEIPEERGGVQRTRAGRFRDDKPQAREGGCVEARCELERERGGEPPEQLVQEQRLRPGGHRGPIGRGSSPTVNLWEVAFGSGEEPCGPSAPG